jgi:hypothetical protein
MRQRLHCGHIGLLGPMLALSKVCPVSRSANQRSVSGCLPRSATGPERRPGPADRTGAAAPARTRTQSAVYGALARPGRTQPEAPTAARPGGPGPKAWVAGRVCRRELCAGPNAWAGGRVCRQGLGACYEQVIVTGHESGPKAWVSDRCDGDVPPRGDGGFGGSPPRVILPFTFCLRIVTVCFYQDPVRRCRRGVFRGIHVSPVDVPIQALPGMRGVLTCDHERL